MRSKKRGLRFCVITCSLLLAGALVLSLMSSGKPEVCCQTGTLGPGMTLDLSDLPRRQCPNGDLSPLPVGPVLARTVA
jgi:hypothetical protein